MKRLLLILCSLVLFTCSSDDNAPEPELKEFEVTYEVNSTNVINGFYVNYSYGNQDDFFNSGFEEVWMQQEWSETLTVTTTTYQKFQLTVNVSHEHTTTLNIYVDGDLKKTETFTGEGLQQYVIFYTAE